MFRQIPRINNSLRPRNRDCFFPAQVQNATNHWHGAKCRAFYSIASSLQERDVFVANEGVNLIASVILRVHSAATPQRVLVTRILCRWLAPEQTDRGSSKPGNINIYRLPKWSQVHHSNMEIDFLFFFFNFLQRLSWIKFIILWYVCIYIHFYLIFDWTLRTCNEMIFKIEHRKNIHRHNFLIIRSKMESRTLNSMFH